MQKINIMKLLVTLLQIMRPDVFDYLVSRGANQNAKDKWGKTPYRSGRVIPKPKLFHY